MSIYIGTGPIDQFLQWLVQSARDCASHLDDVADGVEQSTYDAADAKADLMQCSDTLAEGVLYAWGVMAGVVSLTPPPGPSPQTSDVFTTSANIGVPRTLSMAQPLTDPITAQTITAVTFLPSAMLPANQTTFQIVAAPGGAPGGVYLGTVGVTPAPPSAGSPDIVAVHIQIP